MICYKDKTFCYSDCVNSKCDHHESHVPDNAYLPISWANFSDSCGAYIKPEKRKTGASNGH